MKAREIAMDPDVLTRSAVQELCDPPKFPNLRTKSDIHPGDAVRITGRVKAVTFYGDSPTEYTVQIPADTLIAEVILREYEIDSIVDEKAEVDK